MSVDEFLRLERQAIEALARDLGREVVDKLDRVLVRDILYERKSTEPPARHKVLITLRSERRDAASLIRPTSLDRARCVRDMQRGTERTMQGLVEDLERRGAQVRERFWITPTVAAEAPTEALVAIAARGDVAHVATIRIQWTTRSGESGTGSALTTRIPGYDGTGVRVGILDTGVAKDHPALDGRVELQQDFTGDGIGDQHGHGSQSAGLVASRDDTYPGIAPGATLVDLKMIDYYGSSDPQMALAGLQGAVAAGVDVACCAWGFSHLAMHWSDPPAVGAPDGACVLCSAVDNAVAAGVVVVAAAGNDGSDPASTYDTHVNCPGLAAGAITVGASKGHEAMFSISSVGPTPGGRSKPDLVAPGVGIVTCRPPGTGLGRPLNADFTVVDGTSSATAYVVGVVALMLQKNPQLTSGQVKRILMDFAIDLGAATVEMGAGCVDAVAALQATPLPQRGVT